MKKETIDQINLEYISPEITIVELKMEQGFASSIGDFGDGGEW